MIFLLAQLWILSLPQRSFLLRCAIRKKGYTKSRFYRTQKSVESRRHHEITAERVSQPAADPLEICRIYFRLAPHASPLGLSRHTEVRPSSIRVMLADTICSSLLILADMKHQRRADGQMARNYTSANCFLTLFRLCVYRHSAGVVRSSQKEAQVMTVSGWHAWANPHPAHAHKPERA